MGIVPMGRWVKVISWASRQPSRLVLGSLTENSCVVSGLSHHTPNMQVAHDYYQCDTCHLLLSNLIHCSEMEGVS